MAGDGLGYVGRLAYNAASWTRELKQNIVENSLEGVLEGILTVGQRIANEKRGFGRIKLASFKYGNNSVLWFVPASRQSGDSLDSGPTPFIEHFFKNPDILGEAKTVRKTFAFDPDLDSIRDTSDPNLSIIKHLQSSRAPLNRIKKDCLKNFRKSVTKLYASQ